MSFTYYLPDSNNQKIAHTADCNSVIIIGANGSGKSKLGAWIEQQSLDGIHRICAQRSLNFNENIALKNFAQAEELVFYGTNDDNIHKSRKSYRWDWGRGYTTTLLNDFENVLAALLAKQNNDNRKIRMK